MNYTIQRSTDDNPRSGKELKSEWGHVEAYAATLDWAVRIAVRKFMLESDGITEDMVLFEERSAKAIGKAVENRISQIVVEVQNEQTAQAEGILHQCPEQDEG